jgi:hypothetical protein
MILGGGTRSYEIHAERKVREGKLWRTLCSVAFAYERGACDHRGTGSDFSVESTEGIMTAAIEQQVQTDHEHKRLRQ